MNLIAHLFYSGFVANNERFAEIGILSFSEVIVN